MAFFLQNAKPQQTSGHAVATMFHLLNNFDIPPGSALVDLAHALKAAGDKKVTVEMGPQDRDTFTPSTVVEVN